MGAPTSPKSPRGKSPSRAMEETVKEGKKFVADEKRRERSRSRSTSRKASTSPAPATKKAGAKKATAKATAAKNTAAKSPANKKAGAKKASSKSPAPKKNASKKKASSKSPAPKKPGRRAKSPTGRASAVKIDTPAVADGKKKTADQRAAEEASNWVGRTTRREKKTRTRK